MNDDDYQNLMQTYASETEATQREVDDLRVTLLGRESDAAVSRALVRRLPRIRRAEVDAVRDRVEGARAGRGWAPWALLFVGSAGGGTILAAAIALLVVWVATRPDGAEPIAPMRLAATEAQVIHPSQGVQLRIEGSGEVSGTAQAPQIDWTAGAVTVEVDPGQGIALTVVTREAVVRVIGTVFTVDRDALGTRVDVARGKVEVECTAGPTHALTLGKTATCLPTTAPGLLARANELKKTGAPAGQILEAVDAGLPMATGPFRAELLALQAETLLASGRERQAWGVADQYLEQGGPRRLEVLQIAATSALAVGGCDSAMNYLLALEEAGAGDSSTLERCEERR